MPYRKIDNSRLGSTAAERSEAKTDNENTAYAAVRRPFPPDPHDRRSIANGSTRPDSKT